MDAFVVAMEQGFLLSQSALPILSLQTEHLHKREPTDMQRLCGMAARLTSGNRPGCLDRLNTVKGSLEGQFAHGIVANDAELRAVIDRYPRTVYVSGHSHAYPDIQQIDGTGPLFVNDGAVATGQRVPDTRSYNGAFGWLITVYSDRIDFALRDFLERTWVDGSLYAHTLP